MILTIDVGNTNITCGVFQGDEIAASFRITTKMPRTSDEYGMMLMNLLEQNDIHPAEIKDAIICSVVPNVMHSLRGGLVKYFHITPIVVEAGIKTGIRIVTPNPQQIGADRIVDAVGAYEIYGGPVLVIDFGTATTYDYVDREVLLVLRRFVMQIEHQRQKQHRRRLIPKRVLALTALRCGVLEQVCHKALNVVIIPQIDKGVIAMALVHID